MKLWVDDVRPCPDGWVWAKTFTDAVEILESDVELTDASLDHDLGFELVDEGTWDFTKFEGIAKPYDGLAPTGYDLTKWMVERAVWPSQSLTVHSMNPVGVRNMCVLIEKHGPYVYREPYVYTNPKGYSLNAVRYTKEEDA